MTLFLGRNNLGSLISKTFRYSFNINKNVSSVLPKYFHTSELRNGLRAKWRAPTMLEMQRRVKKLKEEGKYPEPIRSEFIEWNYDAELYAFGKRLNEQFDPDLLRESFIDHLYIYKEKQNLEKIGVELKLDMKSNEELASAGKALIEDFSLKYLRAAWPLLPEEGVQSMVNHLSSDNVLGEIGRQLGFKDLIKSVDYPPSTKTYAQCFSAVVGCLNASSGIEKCQRFILDFVVVQLVGKDLWDVWELDNPHRTLRNILLRSGLGEPEPRLLGDAGRSTIESVYHVGIYDGNKKLISKGYGENTSMAVEVATYNALSLLFDWSLSRAPMSFEHNDLSQFMKQEHNCSLSSWKIEGVKAIESKL